MSKHEIEISGIPEGYELIAVRVPIAGKDLIVDKYGEVVTAIGQWNQPTPILRKIQPRRIVLEEISKDEYCRIFHDENFAKIYDMRGSYWKEANETDLSLTKDDDKLSLSVDECKSISRFLSVSSEGTTKKILEFIKGK